MTHSLIHNISPFFTIAESNYNDHKHELMSFIIFEELLQKYFDHFTVVPKIAFVDVDINALNEFLMRDRPGKFLLFIFILRAYKSMYDFMMLCYIFIFIFIVFSFI